MPLFLALAVMLAASAPADAKSYSFPPFPVQIKFESDPNSPFCLSPKLPARIARDFVSINDTENPDLVLRCEAYDEERVRFRVVDGNGKVADEFKVKVPPDAANYDTAAFLVSRRLATGKKTIRAALTTYQDRVRYGYGKTGSSAFDAGEWGEAAGTLYGALESGMSPGYLYFGLYAAHAKMGHAAQARWYLMAYCESEGKNPAKLDARQLSYLREMPRLNPAQSPPAPIDLSDLRARLAQHQWGAVIWELKTVVEAAPWTVEAYDAIANAYKALGWELLEDNWRERAKLARKTASDKRMHERLLDALAP